MTIKFGCIVEGHGEVQSVPVLIRRIAAELYPELAIDIPRPIRVHRDKVVKDDELEREVEFAARKIQGKGPYLLFLTVEMIAPLNWDLHYFTEHRKLIAIYRLPLSLLNKNLRRGSLQQLSHFVGKED